MEEQAIGFFSVAGVVVALATTLSLLAFSLTALFRSRKSTELEFQHQIISDTIVRLARVYPSLRDWISVATVIELLNRLHEGQYADIDTMREYDLKDYGLNPPFTNAYIDELLESLDSAEQGINVGNNTGLGDEILPTLEKESAKLIRALLVANHDLETQKSAFIRTMVKNRIALSTDPEDDDYFALDQWWVKELENASVTRPTSPDLVRACAVALKLAHQVLPPVDDEDEDENSLS